MRLDRLIALVLFAQILAVPVTSGMLVLCFGSDGHVAVESAGGSQCCREWEADRRESHVDLAKTVEPASGPCCRDMELLAESATLTVPPQKSSLMFVVLCSNLYLPAPCDAVSAAASLLPAESPVAVSLRTIVLRT